MKYEHVCKYGATLVGIKGHRNNSCRKCRTVKGGQPKKIVKFIIDGIDYLITTSHKLYGLRYGILTRCYNSADRDYKYYQGRGINVCEEWRNDPETFYRWAISHGWKEGLAIDRIDSNKDYEPTNCQFITLAENALKSHI